MDKAAITPITKELTRQGQKMDYDFSMAGLRVAGGLVQEVEGRKVLVTVYEGKGRLLSCYTFLGLKKDAPANVAVFFDPKKEKFFIPFLGAGSMECCSVWEREFAFWSQKCHCRNSLPWRDPWRSFQL